MSGCGCDVERKMLSFFFRNISREMFCILMFFLGIFTGGYMVFTQAATVAVVALILAIVIDLFRVPMMDGIEDIQDSIRSVPHYKTPAYIIPDGVAARLLNLSMIYAVQGLLAFLLGLAVIQLCDHGTRYAS